MRIAELLLMSYIRTRTVSFTHGLNGFLGWLRKITVYWFHDFVVSVLPVPQAQLKSGSIAVMLVALYGAGGGAAQAGVSSAADSSMVPSVMTRAAVSAP